MEPYPTIFHKFAKNIENDKDLQNTDLKYFFNFIILKRNYYFLYDKYYRAKIVTEHNYIN